MGSVGSRAAAANWTVGASLAGRAWVVSASGEAVRTTTIGASAGRVASSARSASDGAPGVARSGWPFGLDAEAASRPSGAGSAGHQEAG